MNENFKKLIRRFFNEKLIELRNSGGSFDYWLTDFIILTKAEQYAIIKDWLDLKLDSNTSTISSLDSQKTATEQSLTAENTVINNLKNALN